MGTVIDAVNVVITPDNPTGISQTVPTDCTVTSEDTLTVTCSAFACPQIIGFDTSSAMYESVLGEAQFASLVSYITDLKLYNDDLIALTSQYNANPSDELYTRVAAKQASIENLKSLCQALGATAGTTGSGIYGEFSLGSYGSQNQGDFNQYTTLNSSIGAAAKSIQNLTGFSISCTGGINAGAASSLSGYVVP